MKIRACLPSDFLALFDVFLLNTPKYFHPAEIEGFRTYLQDQWKNYFVIEFDGQILGGTGYQISVDDAQAQISWIFIHPEYSGRGWGKQLVQHCLELFQSHEISKVKVRTSQWADNFFSRFGFITVNVISNYWAEGLDLYEMELINNS